MALKPADVQWSDDGRLESRTFGDVYFQPGVGPDESYYVFLEKNRISPRISGMSAGDEFRVAELGFGTGLNFLLTAREWRAANRAPNTRLHYVSIEKHPLRAHDLEKIHAAWPALSDHASILRRQYPPLIAGFHHIDFPADNIRLTLCFGDVADVLPELSGLFDVWYLDGFAPAKNPAMWEDALFSKIFSRTKKDGTLSTFSSVGFVRRGLAQAGFKVTRTKGFRYKWHMTVAVKETATDPAVKKPPQHVIVLGAGIAGAGVARALAERHVSVTVYDRGPGAGSETSGNPVGVLYPKMTVDPSPMGLFHQHGFCFTRQKLIALNEPTWQMCGVTHSDLSDDDHARTENLLRKNEFPADYMHAAPNGYHQPMAGYVSPPALCARLLDHPFITSVFNHTVNDLADIMAGADAVVIALGNGTTLFDETRWMPLQSLRGQINFLAATPETKTLASVICHDGYVTPAVNGLHYFGATFSKEPPGDTGVRDADTAENVEKLRRHVPLFSTIKSSVTGGRTGFRATTPDKLPLVGACPDAAQIIVDFAGLRTGEKMDTHHIPHLPRLYVSAGFGAHGLSGALLAGDMIAADITDGICPVPQSLREHVLPARFLIRDLKRRKI